jgi:heme-degrading monooxygenase HmoA
MIGRIWHGWTSAGNADAYERLLRTEILPGIADGRVSGFRGAQVLRRDVEEGVEFVTICWFDSLDAVREFAGNDYEKAVISAKAHQLLSRFDSKSQHYEVVVLPEMIA